MRLTVKQINILQFSILLFLDSSEIKLLSSVHFMRFRVDGSCPHVEIPIAVNDDLNETSSFEWSSELTKEYVS